MGILHGNFCQLFATFESCAPPPDGVIAAFQGKNNQHVFLEKQNKVNAGFKAVCAYFKTLIHL